MPAEDGKRLMHAELELQGCEDFLMDDFPEHRGSHGVEAVFPPDQIKGTRSPCISKSRTATRQ